MYYTIINKNCCLLKMKQFFARLHNKKLQTIPNTVHNNNGKVVGTVLLHMFVPVLGKMSSAMTHPPHPTPIITPLTHPPINPPKRVGTHRFPCSMSLITLIYIYAEVGMSRLITLIAVIRDTLR